MIGPASPLPPGVGICCIGPKQGIDGRAERPADFPGSPTLMKHLPNIAGALLGLLFVMAGVVVLFHLVEGPPPEKGSAAEHFMTALGPTGYLTFVKVLEVIGGILVAVPRTRNFGLLVLGPIIVNILAYHAFVTDPKELLSPMLIVICLLAAYLLWCGRKQFAGLLGSR